MQPMELCPELKKDSKGCKKRFCKFRNKEGACSLDFDVQNMEYDIGKIAEVLQVSRQRVWRLTDGAMTKLKKFLADIN